MELIRYVEHALQIMEGWIKWIYDIIRRNGSPRSLDRLITCQDCEHNRHGICNACGCIIKAKVRVEYMEDEEGISIDGCPERKW